jgi:aspartate aminotransferase
VEFDVVQGQKGPAAENVARRLRDPQDRRRDPGDARGRRAGVQPHRRRLRPGAVPHPGGARARIVEALRAGETNYPPSAGVPTRCARRSRVLPRVARARLPAPSRCSSPAARARDLRRLPHARRPGRPRGVPGAVVEQQPLLPPRRRGGRAGGVRPERRLPPHARALAPAVRGRAAARAQLAAQPGRHAFTAEQLAEICDLVLEENARRAPHRRAPLYLMYDQVYWMLTFGGTRT